MKFYVHLSGKNENKDLGDLYKYVNNNGIDGLCLNISEIKKYIEKHGFESVKYFKKEFHSVAIHYISNHYDLIRNNLEHTKNIIEDMDFAKSLSVSSIKLFISRSNDLMKMENEEYENLLRSFKKLFQAAEKKKVSLIFTFTNNHIMRTLSSTNVIFNRFKSKFFKLSIDVISAAFSCKIEPELVYKYFKPIVSSLLLNDFVSDNGEYKSLEKSKYDYNSLMLFPQTRKIFPAV